MPVPESDIAIDEQSRTSFIQTPPKELAIVSTSGAAEGTYQMTPDVALSLASDCAVTTRARQLIARFKGTPLV